MNQINKFILKAEKNYESFVKSPEKTTLHAFKKLKNVEESANFEPIPRHIGSFSAAGMVVNGFYSLADATSHAALASTPELRKQHLQKTFSKVSQGVQTGGSVGAVLGLGVGIIDVYLTQSRKTRKKLKKQADDLLKERNQTVRLRKSQKVTTMALPVPSQLQTDYSRVVGASQVGFF